MSDEQEAIDFVGLPADIIERISEFLSLSDAFRLSRTSLTVYLAFPLSTLNPPITLMPSTCFRGGYAEHHRCGPAIPIQVAHTHSIIILCRWRDQGWGNQKGQLFIVGRDRENYENEFSSGRVVVESSVAPHEEAPLRLTFRPRPGEQYHLWYQIGGGSHHTLDITSDVMMYSVILGTEENKTVSKVMQRLQNAAVSPRGTIPPADRMHRGDFWPGLLHAAIQSLLGQLERKEDLDPFLSQFLESHGFDLNKSSLEALNTLCGRFSNAKLV
jgi:hypothetical protein